MYTRKRANEQTTIHISRHAPHNKKLFGSNLLVTIRLPFSSWPPCLAPSWRRYRYRPTEKRRPHKDYFMRAYVGMQYDYYVVLLPIKRVMPDST